MSKRLITTTSLVLMLAVAAAFALPATVSAGAALDALDGDRAEAQLKPSRARPPTSGSCTMAVPPRRATVEAEIANAADFCELVSHALAGDVFHAPVIVTPGLLWHYADAALSCRLRYGDTRHRMTIRNSAAACRWLVRLAPKWHLETADERIRASRLSRPAGPPRSEIQGDPATPGSLDP